MMNVYRIVCSIVLVIITFPLFCSPTLEQITIYLWCDLEPLISEDDEEFPLSQDEASRRSLEEARIILSAMIYGYEFTYIPMDKTRKASEVFDLVPLSEIQWGDPYLKIIDSKVRDKRLYVTIVYTLQDYQAERLRSWKSVSIPVSAGRGEGDFFKGYKEKIKALFDAMKNAIKNHLQKRLVNKPREVKGEVLLFEAPSTFIHAGTYTTTTRIKLNIKEIVPYRVF
jgi:hypothetical protein